MAKQSYVALWHAEMNWGDLWIDTLWLVCIVCIEFFRDMAASLSFYCYWKSSASVCITKNCHAGITNSLTYWRNQFFTWNWCFWNRHLKQTWKALHSRLVLPLASWNSPIRLLWPCSAFDIVCMASTKQHADVASCKNPKLRNWGSMNHGQGAMVKYFK